MDDLIKIEKRSLPVEYVRMLDNINAHYPAIKRDSENFYKSHSQYMQFTLDVACLTPIRSLRQILAEINKSKIALEEAQYGIKKKNIEICKKRQMLSKEKDDLDKEMLQIEIDELSSQIRNTEDYMMGAIRRISSFVTQYQHILGAIGKVELTEQDYEEDEERYHIMTAFSQALNAARARGGYIDEGNQIYLFQLGINGTQAQAEITSYLSQEEQYANTIGPPQHETTLKWLEALSDKYKGCAQRYLKRRGMLILDERSLHRLT